MDLSVFNYLLSCMISTTLWWTEIAHNAGILSTFHETADHCISYTATRLPQTFRYLNQPCCFRMNFGNFFKNLSILICILMSYSYYEKIKSTSWLFTNHVVCLHFLECQRGIPRLFIACWLVNFCKAIEAPSSILSTFHETADHCISYTATRLTQTFRYLNQPCCFRMNFGNFFKNLSIL
jgi:hypothetical protein